MKKYLNLSNSISKLSISASLVAAIGVSLFASVGSSGAYAEERCLHGGREGNYMHQGRAGGSNFKRCYKPVLGRWSSTKAYGNHVSRGQKIYNKGPDYQNKYKYTVNDTSKEILCSKNARSCASLTLITRKSRCVTVEGGIGFDFGLENFLKSVPGLSIAASPSAGGSLTTCTTRGENRQCEGVPGKVVVLQSGTTSRYGKAFGLQYAFDKLLEFRNNRWNVKINGNHYDKVQKWMYTPTANFIRCQPIRNYNG